MPVCHSPSSFFPRNCSDMAAIIPLERSYTYTWTAWDDIALQKESSETALCHRC